jgi:hypothetical protein
MAEDPSSPSGLRRAGRGQMSEVGQPAEAAV